MTNHENAKAELEMMQNDDSDINQQALQFQKLIVKSTAQLVETKDEELKKAEELPSKSDYD